MHGFIQDLRHAFRGLSKAPVLTTAAIVTLALGIGANSAIFSVVDGVLLHRLPFADPGRLVLVWSILPGDRSGSVSAADLLDWQRDTHTIRGLAGFRGLRVNLTGAGQPERLRGATVSPGFFTTLGVEAARGRTFTPAGEGDPPEVVLSHGFWQRRFAGEPAAVGRSLEVNGQPSVVVGVLPAGFRYPRLDADLWVRGTGGAPTPPTPLDGTPGMARGMHYFRVVGRLAPGATLEEARAEMAGLAARYAGAYPDTNAGFENQVLPLAEQAVGDIRPALLVLAAAVAFVLLIACINVANLLLARAAGREREIALRAALGAPRGRLLAQILAEGTLLAAGGGALGLLLAAWGVDLLLRLAPPELPNLGAVGIDGRVLAFTAALSLLSVLLFGLLPAWRSSRPDLQGQLQDGGERTAGSRRGGALRGLLVVGEVALALVLLTGAGLLLRSFLLLEGVPPGFEPRGVVSSNLVLPTSRYAEEGARRTFYRQALEHLAALPGVESVGLVSTLPMSGSAAELGIAVEGLPEPKPGEDRSAGIQVVSAGYFRTLRIPLLAGRPLAATDDENAAPVALVNRAMADRYWPGEDPLGKRLALGDAGDPDLRWRTVVGVVGDVHHFSLDREVRPEVYFPYLQGTVPYSALVIRTAGDPGALAASSRRAILEVDPDQPIGDIRPMTALVADTLATRRFVLLLLGVFAALALALAAIGIYGVVAYSVALRSREIGIRMALGADAGRVLAGVVGRSLRLVSAAVVLGAAVALSLGRLLSGLLFGVRAHDPTTFALVAAILATVALAASALPAWRAARTDPRVVLGAE